MCLDIAIYFNSLPIEIRILILNVILLITEVVSFFYIRYIIKSEN